MNDGGEQDPVANMTCYKGGETVFNNHRMCDVTSELFPHSCIRPLPTSVHLTLTPPPENRLQINRHAPRPTTTSNLLLPHPRQNCAFQFWAAQVESFYCALEECDSAHVPGWDTNSTAYACGRVKCACVPGRFICGEDGSVGKFRFVLSFFVVIDDMDPIDIGDFLKHEIKGPAKFSCKSGSGCKFEEPVMNDLIRQIFGDAYITLECEGGECLHYSQVPGYVVSPFAFFSLGYITRVLMTMIRDHQNRITLNGSLLALLAPD